MKQKVYIDTSVIGGCFDEEFKEWSNALFQEFVIGSKLIILSDLTLQELEQARQEVRDKVNEVPDKYRFGIAINDEVIQLAETYISEGALTNKSYNDALHIALATLNDPDVLASWNFKHIVNLDRIRLYNSINLRLGYRMIEIRTPREILIFNDDENE
jgi:predicted nucleic acid-binding protein